MNPGCNYDVIVVGGGGSGLAAALSSAEHGARVLLLEKQPQLGGTTALAVGSFTAAGTQQQQRRGIRDSAAAHADDAGRFAPRDIEAQNNAALRQFFLAQAADTLAWLERLGLHFHGPSPEPPNRSPRMHNVVPGARAYIAALEKAARQRGVVIRCGASVVGLVRGDGSEVQNRVVGVETETDGARQTIHARRGVILAAGDYANDPELIGRFKGAEYAAIEGINRHATGGGQRLVEQAGGKLLNMEITYGPELRFIAPSAPPPGSWLPTTGPGARLLGGLIARLPAALLRTYVKRLLVTWQHPENAILHNGAILINRQGERFTNEKHSPRRELDVAAQRDKEAFLLLDGRLNRHYSRWPHFVSTAPLIAYAYVDDYLRLRPDVAVQAERLEAVAKARGINADTLAETVSAFNRHVLVGEGDAFGRRDDLYALERGPWTLLGPVRSYFTTTEGGAAIDEQLRVLDVQGRPIPGLYAVGQNGLGGMILWGHGLHIAWALTSGRLVGRSVMQ